MLSEVERRERKKLVGYCESCDVYTKYNGDIDLSVCGLCGGRFSSKSGQQITTQRSFRPNKKVEAIDAK